jgi:hypothetical protein
MTSALPFRVLSFDGGGYLGLATPAFLSAGGEALQCPYRERFDLFCGKSTGAIIALTLASSKTAKELVELYEDLGSQAFWNPCSLALGLPTRCGRAAERSAKVMVGSRRNSVVRSLPRAAPRP